MALKKKKDIPAEPVEKPAAEEASEERKSFKERCRASRQKFVGWMKGSAAKTAKFFHQFTSDGRYKKMLASDQYQNTNVRGMALVLQESGQSVQTIERAQKVGRVVSLVVTYAFIGFMALVVLFPFYWMLISSVKTLEEYRMSTPTFWPNSTLSSFSAAIARRTFSGSPVKMIISAFGA